MDSMGKIMKTTFLSVAAAALLGLGLSAGCGDDDEPFLIGYSVWDLPTLHEVENAIKFAAEDINAAGGNIRLVDTDLDNEHVRFITSGGEQGTQDRIQLQKFIDMGIKGLIGPLHGAVTGIDILPFVTEKKLVTISPVGATEAISELNKEQPGQHYFFRTIPHNGFQAEVLAEESEDQVAVIYRDMIYGNRVFDDIKRDLERLGRQPPLGIKLPARSPQIPMITDAEARALVETVEKTDGIRNVNSIIILMWSNDRRIISHLVESTVIPANAKYYLDRILSVSDRLHTFIAKEGENPESDEVKARLDGFTGVIAFPHSDNHSHQDLRDFECRFDHSIEYPEEDLLYTTYAYDAVVIMALAALVAGSTDPSVYVHQIADVTKDGTQCGTYAECAGLVRNGADIDYDGLSGPLALDEETGDVTDAWLAVYTYNDDGSRVRDFVEVRDGERVDHLDANEPTDLPLDKCGTRGDH